MAKARKVIGLSANDGVIVFTVCPKCNTLYKSSDCIMREGSKEESKLCSYVQFPNHPQPSQRVSCNTMLMKKVKLVENQNLYLITFIIITASFTLFKSLCREMDF